MQFPDLGLKVTANATPEQQRALSLFWLVGAEYTILYILIIVAIMADNLKQLRPTWKCLGISLLIVVGDLFTSYACKALLIRVPCAFDSYPPVYYIVTFAVGFLIVLGYVAVYSVVLHQAVEAVKELPVVVGEGERKVIYVRAIVKGYYIGWYVLYISLNLVYIFFDYLIFAFSNVVCARMALIMQL